MDDNNNNGDDGGQKEILKTQQKLATMNRVPDVHKSLIIKVYRGPTEHQDDNRKSFASWGYFIKFPNV
ncbi:hypothetical protein HUG17_2958 [Dermatophagoides farinae]|nr:hypothetical protein HUG17_2958 [Dermatophagoides farinae]